MPLPSMLSLPPIEVDSVQWRLPLCDATAMDVAQLLVEPTAATRAARWAAALEVDPALAIWGLLCASQQNNPPGNPERHFTGDRIPLLAEWLAEHCLDCWSSIAVSAAANFAAEQKSQFAALVAESVAAAREATRGLPHDIAVLQPLYLTQLTSHWREWLAAANPQRTVPESIEAFAHTASSPASSLVPSTEARQTADEAWRRWLSEIAGVRQLLPSLAAHAQQHRKLQSHFQSELQTAKLDAMKEFAYGAGHELNNPLANIASRAQMLLADEKDPERRRRLAAINTQAFRAHEMLADMMLFARPPQPRFESVDVVQLADEVLRELADDAAQRSTTLQREGDPGPIFIEADPTHLRVALRALCMNSVEALGEGGMVTIEVRSAAANERDAQTTAPSIQISVADTGPGIPPEIQDKIFDPFFSGREAGRGLGFGLSKCWRIVTMHGGKVEAQNQSPCGAKFVITLPMHQATNQAAASP